MKKNFKFNIPDREPNEGPATQKQIDYILHLADKISEKDVRQLGKWQASSLIDQIKTTMEKHQDKSSRGCGCLGGLALVAIAIVVGVMIGLTNDSDNDGDGAKSGTNDNRVEVDTDHEKPAPTVGQPENSENKNEESRVENSTDPGGDRRQSKPLDALTFRRTWTAKDGRTMSASLLSVYLIEGKYVGVFKKSDEATFEYKIGNLSEEDIELVKELLK